MYAPSTRGPLAGDVEEAAFGDDPGAVGADRSGSLHGRSSHASHRRRCAPPLRESQSRSATRRAHDPRSSLPGAWPRHPYRPTRRRRRVGCRPVAGRGLRALGGGLGARARRLGRLLPARPGRAAGARRAAEAALHRAQLPPARRGDGLGHPDRAGALLQAAELLQRPRRCDRPAQGRRDARLRGRDGARDRDAHPPRRPRRGARGDRRHHARSTTSRRAPRSAAPAASSSAARASTRSRRSGPASRMRASSTPTTSPCA